MELTSAIAREVGTNLNDQGMIRLEVKYQRSLAQLNGLLPDQGLTAADSLEGLYEVNGQEIEGLKGEALNLLKEIHVIKMIMAAEEDIDSFYEAVHLEAVAESGIHLYGLSGRAAQVVKGVYEGMEGRFKALIHNGEHRTLFFNSSLLRTHSLLFKTIYSALIIEGMLLAVLITGGLMNYEYEQGTHLLTYSTKVGRRLNFKKLKASLLAAIMVTTVLVVITLGGYFLTFSHQGLWQVPIASFFNREFPVPNIPWWPLAFWQYLLCTVAIIYGCQILFTLLTYGLTVMVKSSYRVFFLFLSLGALLLLLPGWMPRDGISIFISAFTPFTLVFNSSKWLMESGPFTSFQYYEILTLGVWGAFSALIMLWGKKKFVKEDIL